MSSMVLDSTCTSARLRRRRPRPSPSPRTHARISTRPLSPQIRLCRFAVVLRDMGIVRRLGTGYKKSSPDAISVLCEAITCFPWNWSAWVDLSHLCTSTETVPSLAHAPHAARQFGSHRPFPRRSSSHRTCTGSKGSSRHTRSLKWAASTTARPRSRSVASARQFMSRICFPTRTRQTLEDLEAVFPHSSYILGQLGQAHYMLRSKNPRDDLCGRDASWGRDRLHGGGRGVRAPTRG
jgi:hypothetical protein